MTANERILVLDKTDLVILSTLARNSRSSYSSIGMEVGLTSKSVKARVKKMMYYGVIERCVVRVNPAVFGFKVALILMRTSNGITKDEVIKRIEQISDIACQCASYGKNMCNGANHQKTIK